MSSRAGRAGLLALLCAALVVAQTSPGPATLKNYRGGFNSADPNNRRVKRLARTTLHVANAHERKEETYEGVLLETLLQKAGAPQGDGLRGQLLTSYDVAEAEDGYRVVFALAELDSGFLDSEVLVADTIDGAPLGPKLGPLRLVAPHEKRPARWVRMLKTITVATPAH